MGKNFNEIDLQKAMQLAQSDAGRQLMELLQSKHPGQMHDAMDSARQGDLEAARIALTQCMKDPAMQSLLRQLQEE